MEIEPFLEELAGTLLRHGGAGRCESGAEE
jgi:hypothetical protein